MTSGNKLRVRNYKLKYLLTIVNRYSNRYRYRIERTKNYTITVYIKNIACTQVKIIEIHSLSQNNMTVITYTYNEQITRNDWNKNNTEIEHYKKIWNKRETKFNNWKKFTYNEQRRKSQPKRFLERLLYNRADTADKTTHATKPLSPKN